MTFWKIPTKIFAIFSLLFVSFILTPAQTENDSSIYKLPVGTKILVQMDNEINSKVSSVDDTFTVTIVEPVSVRGTVVVPIGTIIEGRILKVTHADIGRQNGSLQVRFEKMRFADDAKRDIEAVLVNKLEVKSSSASTILSILGGTAIGGIIGAVSKTDNGALIGAGIGTGAGTGVALLQKGKEVKIKTDEKFEIVLTKEVVLPVRDF